MYKIVGKVERVDKFYGRKLEIFRILSNFDKSSQKSLIRVRKLNSFKSTRQNIVDRSFPLFIVKFSYRFLLTPCFSVNPFSALTYHMEIMENACFAYEHGKRNYFDANRYIRWLVMMLSKLK